MDNDLEIVYRDLDELLEYENNARTHSDEQVEQITRSINEFGFTNPILVDENLEIIAGHGRRQAAIKLGIQSVPTITLKGLSEQQRKAYVIADNQLALNANWDFDLLRIDINDLLDSDFDIDIIGFDEGMMSAIFLDKEFGETDANSEWEGMPEFNQEDKTAFRTMQIHFACQQHVDDFAALIQQSITDKTKYVWFPNIEIETYADKSYE